MELISVIVPVYNVEKYLYRCVESICVQSYQNLEIILVDDGSLDNSGKMCDELKEKDYRIKVVHKENEGLGFARNSGLKEVTGKYVTFIDSDDWIAPDHIENLYNVLKLANADACIGGYTRVNTRGEKLPIKGKIDKRIYSENEITNNILLPLIGPDVDFKCDIQVESSCCMNLYSMYIISKYNLKFISERYAVAEDLYFNIDYFHYAIRVVASDEIGYYYFENNESISRKYNPARFERTVNFYTETKKRIEQYDLEDKISYRLDRSYLTKIRVTIRHIVMSDLKYSHKISEIQKIAMHPLTREVINKYPIDTFIPAMRLYAKLLKKLHITGVYWMFAVREWAGKKRFFKYVLKKIGISR